MIALKKKCTACSTPKFHDEFHSNSGKRDGLETQCRACKNSRRKKRRELFKSLLTDKFEIIESDFDKVVDDDTIAMSPSWNDGNTFFIFRSRWVQITLKVNSNFDVWTSQLLQDDEIAYINKHYPNYKIYN